MEKCPRCSRLVDRLVRTNNVIWGDDKICFSCNLKTDTVTSLERDLDTGKVKSDLEKSLSNNAQTDN